MITYENYACKWKKVPFTQYKKDMLNFCNFSGKSEEVIEELYSKIQLPRRETPGSAGYDFFLPFTITLKKGQSIMIPTGISLRMHPGKVLFILPRSGQGSKLGIQITNTCGVVDSDYDQEEYPGHIFIKITYNGVNNVSPVFHGIQDSKVPITLHDFIENGTSDEEITLYSQTAFAQGIILDYYLAINEYYDGMPAKGRYGTGNIGK